RNRSIGRKPTQRSIRSATAISASGGTILVRAAAGKSTSSAASAIGCRRPNVSVSVAGYACRVGPRGSSSTASFVVLSRAAGGDVSQLSAWYRLVLRFPGRGVAVRYLFNLAYGLAALTAAPWLAYAAWRHGKYREGWREKLLGLVARPKPGGPCVWLHAVSVGEVNLLAPLLTLFRARHPDWRVVISTTTLAGRRLAEQRYGEQATIIYCPLDFSWAVAAAMRRIRPRLLVLAELELWPNLIAAARRSGAKVVVVNGRLSERSFRGYRRIRGLLRRTLASVDLFAVQNQAYAERFIQLGAPAERVRVSGSVKFDGAITDRRNPQSVTLARLWNVEGTAPVFVAGSTQHPEEQLVLDAYRHLRGEFPTLRL